MIKNLLGDDEPTAGPSKGSATRAKSQTVIGLFDSVDDTDKPADEAFSLSSAPRVSDAETARRFGLAWSLGIAFFSAVVFMLVLGWGADLLFGTSPWGVVAGIVIGSLIGFFQLFRISAQIFKN
ncbi:MAG: AtpZ/AtpI family protein [Pyrinomonadaceae bacterium]